MKIALILHFEKRKRILIFNPVYPIWFEISEKWSAAIHKHSASTSSCSVLVKRIYDTLQDLGAVPVDRYGCKNIFSAYYVIFLFDF